MGRQDVVIKNQEKEQTTWTDPKGTQMIELSKTHCIKKNDQNALKKKKRQEEEFLAENLHIKEPKF